MPITYTRPVLMREDDDPCPPECGPLDSAQAKRAARMPVTIEPLAIDTSRRETVAISVG